MIEHVLVNMLRVVTIPVSQNCEMLCDRCHQWKGELRVT